MPRSNAARAASRCATGAFGASRMRGGSANFYALRRALHTPHASLMQDVPCLPLSGLLATFAAIHGPKVVGPSACRTDTRQLSSPGPHRTPPVQDRYTTDTRRESPFQAVPSPEHTRMLRRTRPRVPPWPPCMLCAHNSLSLLDHLACPQHAAPTPSRPALQALGLRQDRSRRVQRRSPIRKGL